MGLLDSLAQAIGNKQGSPQFSDIAQDAPNDVLAKGITAAFNSDQTPAIGNMVSQLFAQSNGAQQAGMLNQLMTSLGPAVMGSLAGGTLAKVMAPGSGFPVDAAAGAGRRQSREPGASRCRRPARRLLCRAPRADQHARRHRGHRRDDEDAGSLVGTRIDAGCVPELSGMVLIGESKVSAADRVEIQERERRAAEVRK